LHDPEKRGRREADMGRLQVLYGTQFGLILENGVTFESKFLGGEIGLFYGEISE
jgi:hypothetical protein